MASQTSTSASDASASTSSSSNQPSLFTPGASPPLILAFLAIGLFTISMIAVFGWRRAHLGRRAALQQIGVPDPQKRRREFGETPKLWDLWGNTTKAVADGKDVGWDGIMPVAVMVISDNKNESSRDDAPRPSASTSSIITPDRHHRWPFHLRRSASTGSYIKMAPLTPKTPTLQVAVAIAMPSPRPNHSNTPTADDAETRLDYAIGLYYRAWQEEGG